VKVKDFLDFLEGCLAGFGISHAVLVFLHGFGFFEEGNAKGCVKDGVGAKEEAGKEEEDFDGKEEFV
jgi:hypothetical protein